MSKIFIIILLINISGHLLGQQEAFDGPKLKYSNQFYAGGQLNTAGWGVQGYLGKYDGFYKVKTKGIEIVKLKHPKEFKLISSRENSRRFAYGKLNSFQTIRFVLGRKKLLSDKLRHGAVAVGYSWVVGPSFGILKPVYVEVQVDGQVSTTSIERYDPELHTFETIRGRANFLNGLTELKPVLGGVAKASLIFEYSGVNDGIQQVEVGASVDVFSRKVPIMVDEAENQMFFPAIFMSYSLGKKYIRR